MNSIGPDIEKQRLAVGLSRSELAHRCGVGAQAVGDDGLGLAVPLQRRQPSAIAAQCGAEAERVSQASWHLAASIAPVSAIHL